MTATETPFRLGYRAGRSGELLIANPYPPGTKGAKAWNRAWKLASKVGRGLINDLPHCLQPADCRAAKPGRLCVSCNMKRLHADPEFAARRDSRFKAATESYRASPEGQAQAIVQAENLRVLHQSPEWRKRRSVAMKANMADPEYRAKAAAASLARFERPGEREKQAAHMRKVARDPALKQKAVKTRRAKGHILSATKTRKIAEAVRDTEMTCEEIGTKFSVSASRVWQIAQAAGCGRGRGWKPKRPTSPPES